VLAEALVGDAAQHLELKKRWRLEKGNGHTRDETLVCRQGPLYRHAPVGFHPRGNEPGQGGWELAVEQLAAALGFPLMAVGLRRRLGFPLGWAEWQNLARAGQRPRPDARGRLGSTAARVWLPGSPPHLVYWSIPRLTI